jgi:predicted Zn-dependent protease with MMP-like domain
METTSDLDDIARYADHALAALPDPFNELCEDILLEVTDWPPEEVLADLDIDDPHDLTGLYEGIPLTEKSNAHPTPFPDRIWLYAEPILAEWRDRRSVTLQDLVAHIVVHEVAHHFGWSDAEIAQIDRWWE